jgi:hypothetical protein
VRRAVVAAVALALAVVTAIAVLRLSGGESIAARDDVVTAVSIEPRHHLFGDTIRAQADVVLDRERVDPATVTLRTSFAPYEQVEPATFKRTDVGGVTHLRWVFRLVCLDDTCMPDGPDSVVDFPPATVVADGRSAAEIVWPPVAIASRIARPTGTTAARGWSLPAGDVPSPTFRIAPDVAARILAVLAAFLVGGGVLLLVVAFRRGPRVPRALPPLERALALLDVARRAHRQQEERKALDLLSVELSREGEGELARAATELAWARQRPAPDATDEVTERVEELVRNRNGTHA